MELNPAVEAVNAHLIVEIALAIADDRPVRAVLLEDVTRGPVSIPARSVGTMTHFPDPFVGTVMVWVMDPAEDGMAYILAVKKPSTLNGFFIRIQPDLLND